MSRRIERMVLNSLFLTARVPKTKAYSRGCVPPSDKLSGYSGSLGALWSGSFFARFRSGRLLTREDRDQLREVMSHFLSHLWGSAQVLSRPLEDACEMHQVPLFCHITFRNRPHDIPFLDGERLGSPQPSEI